MVKRRKKKPPKISDLDWQALVTPPAEASSAPPLASDGNAEQESIQAETKGENFAELLASDQNLLSGIAEKLSHTRIKKPKPARSTKAVKVPEEIEVIDLHGLTLEQAKSKIDLVFKGWIASPRHAEHKVRIITGKGRNSGHAGGVLAQNIYAYVARKFQTYITQIDSDPMDTALGGGLPLRGHFDLHFKM